MFEQVLALLRDVPLLLQILRERLDGLVPAGGGCRNVPAAGQALSVRFQQVLEFGLYCSPWWSFCSIASDASTSTAFPGVRGSAQAWQRLT
ncbi:hypothetical protein ETD83_42180, partial [Actinomadura soli]